MYAVAPLDTQLHGDQLIQYCAYGEMNAAA